MPLFQFIGAAVGAGAVVVFASLVWPKITSQPRPESLDKVRDVVMETEVGKNIANTLGVTNDTTVTPVSISSLAASAAQTVVTNIVKETQNTVTTKVLESAVKQFDQLPQAEQSKFRQLICTPSSE